MNNDNISSWNLKDLICIPDKNFLKEFTFSKIARKRNSKVSRLQCRTFTTLKEKKSISNIKVFSSIIVNKDNSNLIGIKHVIVIISPMYFLWLLLFDIYSPKYEYRIAYVLNLMHLFLQNCCKKLECLHVEKNQTTLPKCDLPRVLLNLLFNLLFEIVSGWNSKLIFKWKLMNL